MNLSAQSFYRQADTRERRACLCTRVYWIQVVECRAYSVFLITPFFLINQLSSIEYKLDLLIWLQSSLGIDSDYLVWLRNLGGRLGCIQPVTPFRLFYLCRSCYTMLLEVFAFFVTRFRSWISYSPLTKRTNLFEFRMLHNGANQMLRLGHWMRPWNFQPEGKPLHSHQWEITVWVAWPEIETNKGLWTCQPKTDRRSFNTS